MAKIYDAKLRPNYFSVNVSVLAVVFRQQIYKNLILPDKETPIQVFFCRICNIFKDTCIAEHLRTTVSLTWRTRLVSEKIAKVIDTVCRREGVTTYISYFTRYSISWSSTFVGKKSWFKSKKIYGFNRCEFNKFPRNGSPQNCGSVRIAITEIANNSTLHCTA